MKKYILSSCLAVMTLLSACDNYLDLTPKGESVLNKTSDYIGLIEDMYGLPIETEPYLSGDVSYYDMTTIESYTLPLVSASFFWNEEFDRAAYSTKTGNDDM
ncbi:MAG: RagB/SusD family nutrient uptake outer membrane protein, partial [Phocaeicola sp.]